MIKRTLSPSSFWTFFLTRLSMNGLRIMCSLRSWCSLRLLPPLLSPPAAAFSMSRENHSLNSSWLSNSEGMMKWSSAHSSGSVKVDWLSGDWNQGGRTARELTVHRVLDRRSGEEQSVPAVEAEEGLPSGRRRALDCLGLVEDHVLPLDTLEVLLVRHDLRTHVMWIRVSHPPTLRDPRARTILTSWYDVMSTWNGASWL